jgi:hypothetical protein
VNENENQLYDPAAAGYAAGRADQLSGYVDVDRAVASKAYRHGQQDERTAAVDAELLELAERGEVRTMPILVDQTFVESTTEQDGREQ